MRLHILSDLSGTVLALEIAHAERHSDYGSFVAMPGQACHDIEAGPETLRLIQARETRARLTVVVEAGTARLTC